MAQGPVVEVVEVDVTGHVVVLVLESLALQSPFSLFDGLRTTIDEFDIMCG